MNWDSVAILVTDTAVAVLLVLSGLALQAGGPELDVVGIAATVFAFGLWSATTSTRRPAITYPPR